MDRERRHYDKILQSSHVRSSVNGRIKYYKKYDIGCTTSTHKMFMHAIRASPRLAHAQHPSQLGNYHTSFCGTTKDTLYCRLAKACQSTGLGLRILKIVVGHHALQHEYMHHIKTRYGRCSGYLVATAVDMDNQLYSSATSQSLWPQWPGRGNNTKTHIQVGMSTTT